MRLSAAALSSFKVTTSGVGRVGNRFSVVLVEHVLGALAPMGERLEAGNPEQPGAHFRAAFEFRRLAPEFEKDLVCDIVGHGFRSGLPRREPVDAGVVAHEKKPDGSPVPARHPVHKFAVGRMAGIHRHVLSERALAFFCRIGIDPGSSGSEKI